MSIEDKCNSYIIDNARLTEELAACQANNRVLRDALDTWYVDRHGNQFRDESDCEKALAQPSDDTALRAALAAERERCAKEAEKEVTMEGYEKEIARAIRALGDE